MVTDPPGISRHLTVKGFPWRRRGVLVPTRDRRTAALGICMFTASKPTVLAAQALSFWLVRLAGTTILPGRAQAWVAPFSSDEWGHLLTEWHAHVGAFDAMALYQRRQAERDGLTLMLTRRGVGIAVVKVRAEAAPLRREQLALAAAADARGVSFRAPGPLGFGSLGHDLHWSAQTAVFERPHRPVLEAPPGLFEDVRDVLARVLSDDESGAPPAHNDLTPWNLRRDHQGCVWLYDWEDWEAASSGRDEVYFLATAAALVGRRMPPGLPSPALQHWRGVVLGRTSATGADRELNARILSALDQAWAERAETETC